MISLLWLKKPICHLFFRQKEEDILRRLTKCAVWYGRYPVPSSYKDYKPVMFSDGEQHIVSGFSSTDVQRIKKIIDEIQELLSKANS
jgi:hypothetical protein